MEYFKRLMNKTRLFFAEKSILNLSVKDEMLMRNAQRITHLEWACIIINIALIVYFLTCFTPNSVIQTKWYNGIIMIHVISIFIVFSIMLGSFLIRKKKKPNRYIKMIESIFIIYLLSFGTAIVMVDQYLTINITAFLIVCTVLGVFILKKPMDAFLQYLAAYILFFNAIGLYQKEATALITNRVNGFVFAAIGICISMIIWRSERSSILQGRKIQYQQKKLEDAAYYDDLTGLINRRKWTELLNDEFEGMKRYDHQSSILLLDIDNFKSINDAFGHPAGDRILQKIAALLKDELRACDKICRWG